MSAKSSRAGVVTAAAVCLLLSDACASDGRRTDSSSDAGRKRTVLLSTEYDDLSAGEYAAEEIEAELGVYDAPELTSYVAEVGRRLVGFAPLRPFQYTFQVVDQMVPNAFSLPGGHIYVSRGLVALANSEDELAGVLGHEIIHAAERHAAAQQELERRTSPLLMPYVRMARFASYSRDHERAADRGGQEIAARAGYDPAALSEFLKHLGDSERLTIGYSRLTSYFDTHPGTTERVATTAAQAMTLPWTRDPTRPAGRDEYLRRIEGVVLDTDPSEGIFRETEFIHPDLDFRILFPRGWTLVNTHQAVGAVSPDGNARIIITLEAPLAGPEPVAPGDDSPSAASGAAAEPAPPPQTPTPREAADRFASNPEDDVRVRVTRDQPVQIGEIEALRLDFEGSMGPISVAGQATFIPHRDVVLRLMSVATSGAWSQFVGRAHTAARTFRPLTDEERRDVTVLHLRLASALADEDLAGLGQRTANAWGPGPTAVLNGVFVDVRFEEGQLVKIAKAVPYAPRRQPPPEEPPSGTGEGASAAPQPTPSPR